MPFKTPYGSHYHMTEGCHGATISCGTEGLTPCSDCCKAGTQAGAASGKEAVASAPSAPAEPEPTNGPAIFTREFTTPESDGVYAIRIDRDHDSGQESVTSKGNAVGTVMAPVGTDEDAHMEGLTTILDMTSADDSVMPQQMPASDGISPDEVRSIYFDMDGTLADLYSVPDWLPKLRAFDSSPYEDATPLVDMGELNEAIQRLQRAGWHVGVVSWLSKVSDDGYSRAVSASKRLWLMRNLPTVDEINLVSYGVAKQTAVAHQRNSILVDDEPQNLDAWHDEQSGRMTIDASVPNEMLRRVKELSFAS